MSLPGDNLRPTPPLRNRVENKPDLKHAVNFTFTVNVNIRQVIYQHRR